MRPCEQRNRDLVYNHYGRACVCCAATDDLTLDHSDGDGREHRDQLFGRRTDSHAIYRWIIRNGFPEGFQTMCRPCNTSKGRTRRCRLDHGSRITGSIASVAKRGFDSIEVTTSGDSIGGLSVGS